MATPTLTLRQVAQQANVSVATVSYVLSGKGRMAPETRRKVERLLREAGIRPRHKRYPVFYLCDHREFRDMQACNPFLQLYDGLNASFHQAEITLRVEFLHKPGAGGLRGQLEQLHAARVGGVILDSNLRDDVEHVGRFFEQQKVPAVQVGHAVRAPGIDAVVVDNFGGAHGAVRHLIDRGHTRIATIRWNVGGDPASSKKYAGYTCALNEAGLPIRPQYVVESPFTKEDHVLPGRVAIERLLSLDEPPTAVFVENSFISPGLIYPSDATERQLPEPIAALDIVHFEAWHLEWVEQVMAGKLNYPPRRTKLLRINWEELGHVAAKRLLTRMESDQQGGEVIQVVPRLIQVEGYESTPLEVTR
jgi:DNA-binding LacI/PurR family transcriptional regulator